MPTQYILVFLCFVLPLKGMTQEDTVQLSLKEVLEIAYTNQPALRYAVLEREITEQNVHSNLSGWFPQAGVEANYFRYFEQPVAIFPDFNNPESGQFQEVRTGVPFNSNVNFFVNQSLLNNDLFRARSQASPLRQAADQNTELVKIDLHVNVGQAFYEALLRQEETRIFEEDLERQMRQLKDARLLYEAGISDNIDYKRATITIKNTRSAIYQARENYQVSLARLRELAGIKSEQFFELAYDMDELIAQVQLDTLEEVNYERRYEMQFLQSQRSLQETELSYARRAYIPTLSAFFNYNLIFQTLQGNQVFDRPFPNSLAGFRLAYPIFQGGKRNYDIRAADLMVKQYEVSTQELELQIDREYQEALSAYKANRYQWQVQEEVQELAEEIYNTVSLQYEEGIKNFLEVIQAETDLRTSRINYINAIFRLMTSKLELQRARGEILTENL